MKILILGATGMLGYSLFSTLSEYAEFSVFGTVRSIKNKEHFFENSLEKLITGIDVCAIDSLYFAIKKLTPDLVINCIGLIKQYDISKKHIDAITINSLLPHKIAEICSEFDAKLIHFSTDCIFDGSTGNYTENSTPSSKDLYGRSKLLGEVDYAPHLTLRTSIIGHELTSKVSLIDWFLSQEKEVNGYTNAIFSGLPTCYIGKLIGDNIEKIMDINGLYNLSSDPISKYDLLILVSKIYEKDIFINAVDDFRIDRSLNSLKLQREINFIPHTWVELVEIMNKDYKKNIQVRRGYV